MWQRWAADPGKSDDAGFCALLLSNLIERAAPDASGALYRIATTLLGCKLTAAHFGVWLRTGSVNVQRLADHLDHALPSAATQFGKA